MGGGRTLVFVSDFASIRCDAAAVCTRCGRTAVYDAQALCAHLRRKRKRHTIEGAGAIFTCRRCGAKAVAVRPFPIEHRPEPLPPPEVPVPLYVLPPGRLARELVEAERELAAAIAEADGTLPAEVRKSDARRRVREARHAFREALNTRVDY